MTTLVLAHKKIKSFLPAIDLTWGDEWFEGINKKGLITYLTIGVMAVSMMAYLASLYIIFDMGFKMRDGSAKLFKLEDNVLSTELKYQSAETQLTTNKDTLLSSMQEISSITYLTTDSATLSMK